MSGCRVRSILGTVAACALLAGSAVADSEDSRFDISQDGARVDFDVRDVPRRDVLNRLFAGTGIEIRWISASFGDERMSGKFSGPAPSVARQLLAQTSFVLVHGDADQSSRVIRVVVVGPAGGEPSSAALAALAVAMPPSRPTNGAPTAEADRPSAHTRGQAPLSESGRSVEAARPLRPAPPGGAPLPTVPSGAEAPRLIPPAPDAALPLIQARPGAAAPPLIPPAPTGVNN
jgi:hypothetical protein